MKQVSGKKNRNKKTVNKTKHNLVVSNSILKFLLNRCILILKLFLQELFDKSGYE